MCFLNLFIGIQPHDATIRNQSPIPFSIQNQEPTLPLQKSTTTEAGEKIMIVDLS